MIQKNPKRNQPPKDFSVYQMWGWILLVWSLYRFFISVPEWADELVFKPLVFVLPVLWYVRSIERRPFTSLGITKKNLFPALTIGVGFGMVFAFEGLAANYLKYGYLRVDPIAAFETYGFFLIVLSLATAFSEELLSRGFVFTRIYEQTRSFFRAASLSTLMFLLLHIPILVSTHQYTGMTLVLFLATDVILGMANAAVFQRSKSLVAPILVHLFWNMTVAMYL